MKNISKIFLSAFACIAMFSACTEQTEELGTSVSVNPESLNFDGIDASSETVTVTAEGEWLAVAPEWITVSPNFGSGTTTVTITASDNIDPADNKLAAARSAEITFEVNGKYAALAVSQEGDPDKAPAEIQKVTVAEFLDLPETQTYYELTGTISNIANTEYGNFDLVDETGSVYCYGLLPEEGGQSGQFASLGLAEGDRLTLRGRRSSYSGTPQIGGAYYVSHVPSLLVVAKTSFELEKEAGTFCVATVVKGDVVLADTEADWLKLVGSSQDGDTTRVVFSYSENTGAAPRMATVTLSSVRFGETEEDNQTSEINVSVRQMGNTPEVSSIADAISANAYANLNGTITAVCERGFILTDASASILIYYGAGYDGEYGIGDEVQVVGQVGSYNNGPQINGPDIVKLIKDGDSYDYPAPVKLDASAIDALAGASGLMTITYFEATGTPGGQYHNIAVNGTSVALAFYYVPDSFNVGSYDGNEITVRGYYITRQSGRINFIVTEIQAE